MTHAVVTVNAQGRLVVPAELRRELHIAAGETLVATVEDGRLVLERREQAIQRMQANFARRRRGAGSMVDSLLQERRAEAAREN